MSEQNKSLTKALSILEYLGQFPNGVSLQKITRDTGASKTSVHRALSTFEEMGYVTQISGSKDYRLTMKLMHIGQSAINSDVTGVVKPHLSMLRNELQQTVNFLGFDGDHIIFKDKLEPSNASFRTRTYVGLHSPMYCSAAGKCFLAFVSDAVREAYWQRNVGIMKPFTANTILDKGQFFASLDQVRERGYALDEEENEEGISCVAVPILNKEGMPTYAVSISTLTPKINNLGREFVADKIKQATQQIQAELF